MFIVYHALRAMEIDSSAKFSVFLLWFPRRARKKKHARRKRLRIARACAKMGVKKRKLRGGGMDEWNELYQAARRVQNGRTISPFIEAGGVAAALKTKAGNMYVGVCIDTASTLGMCAERNAIANMITNGESRIDKIVAVTPDGKVSAPCGACREYMMQLDRDSGEIEVLLDLETRKTVRLKDLIPDWWGAERFLQPR